MKKLKTIVTLRFALYGCKNRPFFHIVATNRKRPRNYGALEQVYIVLQLKGKKFLEDGGNYMVVCRCTCLDWNCCLYNFVFALSLKCGNHIPRWELMILCQTLEMKS